MSQSYREFTRERPRRTVVVRYRPVNVLAVLALTATALGLSAISYYQALASMRSVALECDRGGEDACTVVRQYGPITTRERVPIDALHSVSIASHSAKSGTNYSAVLLTKHSKRIALMRPGSRADAESARAAIERVALDRTPGKRSTPIQGPAPLVALFALLMGTGLLAAPMLFNQNARLELDFERGELRYTKYHFPLRPERRTIPVRDLRRAVLATYPGSKGATYGVELQLARGANVFLAGHGNGGSEKRARRKVDEINALLKEHAQ